MTAVGTRTRTMHGCFMSTEDLDAQGEVAQRKAFSEISRILGSKQPSSRSLIELLRIVGSTVQLDVALVSRLYRSTDMAVLNTYISEHSSLRQVSRRTLSAAFLGALQNEEKDGHLDLNLEPSESIGDRRETAIVTIKNFTRRCILVATSPHVSQCIPPESLEFIERVSDAFGLLLNSRDELIQKRIDVAIATGHHEIARTLLRSRDDSSRAELVKATRKILTEITRCKDVQFHIPGYLKETEVEIIPASRRTTKENNLSSTSIVRLSLHGQQDGEVTLRSTKPISDEVLNSMSLILDLFVSGISYLLEAERADRISKDTLRLALALNRVPMGVIISSAHGDISYWNVSARMMFGYGEDERANIYDLLDENDTKEEFEQAVQAAKNSSSTTINLQAKRKDGAMFHSTWMGANLGEIAPDHDSVLWTVHDSSESTTVLKALEYQANRDYLTGMLNMRALMNSLKSVVSNLKKPFFVGVVFVDLDDFKSVNDTYGHHIGDALLKIVGQRIESCLRDGDIAGRISGDEFLAILPVVASTSHAERIARRISRTLVEHPASVEGVSIRVSASVGVATTNNATTSPEDLIRQADNSMYAMKRGGRLSRSIRRADILNSEIAPSERIVGEVLGDALNGGDQLRVTYSPIYDLTNHAVFGISSSLQLEDPRIGCVSYPSIARAAEVTGLHFSLLEWYLSCVNEELDEHFERKTSSRLSNLVVAIKISRKTLEDSSRVVKALRERGKVVIASVILEFDRSALDALENIEHQLVFGTLRQSPYSLAVEVDDDIGSLLSLSDLSPHYLKLSPGFHTWRKMEPFMSSLASLSQSLDSELVALEVNSNADLEVVQHHVRFIQGGLGKGSIGVEKLEQVLNELDRDGLN